MKRLPIPACQRIVAWDRQGPGLVPITSRLCGGVSVAVMLDKDGQERFVCSEHDDQDADAGPPWRLHRRAVAAAPAPLAHRTAPQRRVVGPGSRGPLSPAAREALAAGQRRRRERERAASAGQQRSA